MLEKYFNRRIFTVTLLGFSSGLPLALSGATLQQWFSQSGIDIKTIGVLVLIGIPYTCKFLWAPLLDRIVPPFLGRRRGWILVFQLLLILFIILMSFLNPIDYQLLIVIVAITIAFLSASQDIAINSYQVNLLSPEERKFGVALHVEAYRLAMLVSGGGSFLIAHYYGWQAAYLGMAFFMLVGLLGTLIGPKVEITAVPITLYETVIEPFVEFLTRRKALLFIVFIILYKLGDAFAVSLTSVFMDKELQMTLKEIAYINKTVSLFASLIGIFVGGILMTRINLYWALLFFGFLQAASNFLFMVLAIVGKSYILALNAVFFEYLCGGMGTAAFASLLIALCNRKFSATQYALLSSLMAIGRVWLAALSGVIISYVGWANFYLFTVFVAMPGLILLWLMRKDIMILDKTRR